MFMTTTPTEHKLRISLMLSAVCFGPPVTSRTRQRSKFHPKGTTGTNSFVLQETTVYAKTFRTRQCCSVPEYHLFRTEEKAIQPEVYGRQPILQRMKEVL